ncbi:MAG: ATP-binding cassette domain-containing protein [Anaerolineae bacterium]|nr:ATP-binding cassette domain-containing protein [Anaerolineae bacterium]
MTPTVTVSHVSKSFGTVKAVRDVSFEVHPGEIFGLLGPNGAGKTTTLRMMMDIFKPESGAVTLFGDGLTEEAKNRIGYLPEERGLYKDLKLEPTLVYLATLKGLSEAAAKERLEGWLKRFDLWDHRGKKVQELSKGMQQKAQIVATLLHEPDLIVIDEPFSGLDPVNTRLVKEIIEEQQAAGRAIIMSTHQMYQVEALCSRIVLIDKGETVLYGEVDQIKRKFAGNAVILEGQGDFSNLPGVLEARQRNGALHLALAVGAHPQDIFRALAAREDVKVERFEIAEPSLDDIFITVVKGGAGEEAADDA